MKIQLMLFFVVLCSAKLFAEHGGSFNTPAAYEACDTERTDCESKTSGLGLAKCFKTYNDCLAAARQQGEAQDANTLYSEYGYVPPVRDLRQHQPNEVPAPRQ